MNWVDGRENRPDPGQRCIVWDEDYRQGVFAYWDDDEDYFLEWNEGKTREVRGLVWMPEPDKPDGLSLIMGKALRGT